MTVKPVVVGVDGSEESLQAVDWAAMEAVLRGAPLRIVSAAELLPGMMAQRHDGGGVDTVADAIREQRDQTLAAAAQRAAAAGPGLVIDTDQLSGPIAQAVTDSGSGASMLVVGSRGRGAFAAMILGSVSRFAATHASCPVVVVRDARLPEAHRQVGVGIRDADTGADAIAFAFAEAALRGAGLTLASAVHAPHFPPTSGDVGTVSAAAAQLAALLASWQDKYPAVQVSQEVVPGHPGRALADLSARADLVVIGRRAPRGQEHGAAGVTHALLNHARGPVVTVPSA